MLPKILVAVTDTSWNECRLDTGNSDTNSNKENHMCICSFLSLDMSVLYKYVYIANYQDFHFQMKILLVCVMMFAYVKQWIYVIVHKLYFRAEMKFTMAAHRCDKCVHAVNSFNWLHVLTCTYIDHSCR